MTFLSVRQPQVLDDLLLTVVQIPGLCQKDAFSPFVLTDGIEGLAHTLSSGLMRKEYVYYEDSTSFNGFIISTEGSSTNLLHLIDVLCLLDVELKDVQDTSVDVQHHC